MNRERPEETRRARTRGTYQSGSGIVKRQVHRSPVRECKLIGQGRGASFEEIPVAHEARVLVSQVVGSRNRSLRILFVLRGKSQGEP